MTFTPFVKEDSFSMESLNNKFNDLVEDFNADNAKIDAALKNLSDSVGTKADASALATLQSSLSSLATTVSGCGNCHIEVGTYTGSGTYGSTKSTSIKLSKKPLLLFIAGNSYVAVAAAGLDFMVKFGHPLDPIWWYHFDELESIVGDKYKYNVMYTPIDEVNNVRV